MVRWMRASRLALVSCRTGPCFVFCATAEKVMRVAAAKAARLTLSRPLKSALQRAANFRRSIERKLLQYKTWRAMKCPHRSIRTSCGGGMPPSPLFWAKFFEALRLGLDFGCKVLILLICSEKALNG